MKKQIKFKTYLLISIIFFCTKLVGVHNTNRNSIIFHQDTLKINYYQFQKINEISEKVDSVKLKWDAIEKSLKEKQQPK